MLDGALSHAWLAVLFAVGCGASVPPMTATPVSAPEPASPVPRGEPEAKEAPAALPFRLPCAADDEAGCARGCEEKRVEDCVTLGAMLLPRGAGARDRAAQLLRGACEDGSARGCVRLGDAYHAGLAVPPDAGADAHAEELSAYRRACDAGANQGCLAAGRALVAGHGAGKDPARAAALFGKICARGNAEACLELGRLHRRGEGAPLSPERALALFRKACGLGLSEGCLYVSPTGDEPSPRE